MTSGPRLSAKKRIAPRRTDAAGATVESTEIVPIRTRELTKNYGDLVAVDHLNLEVRAGEIFGLLGQNGAGKTTTILMLLGLTEPTAGQARVAGLDPARHPLEVKRRVGYMPDAVGFYTDMTGRENLRYTSRLNRIPAKDAEMEIEAVLDQVGLTSRADDTVETYSRGMLQRLGIADALVKDPDILILDEPTTAIDPLGVVEILDLLRRLVRERNMAILLSSHLLNQVQSVCDRIGIFASGRLIGQGTLSQLAERVGESKAHVEVAFDGVDESSAGRIGMVLGGIEGVKSAKAGRRPTDPWTLAIDPTADEASVRRRVPLAVSEHGLQLVSLRAVEPSLEDIYRHAVARTQPAHGAVA
ncbi:MAG TPA: ABC transporter ATP-binding protein [Candidatus Limnocylindrales bacterium]|nr:ABC transporter ATP-binding protein [Candidatus Limnocylindrales bacterium]